MPLTLEQYATWLDTRDLPWPAPPDVEAPKARPHLKRLPVRAVTWNVYGTLLAISQGELLFEHPQLAEEVLLAFGEETAAERSYRVVIEHGRIGWQDGAGETTRLLLREPAASIKRRMLARVISMLPIESQL